MTHSEEEVRIEDKKEIGCCGAYCRTCRASTTGSHCRGCKLGYDTGERDINRTKCKIKVCCFKEREYETCADCEEYPTCKIIESYHDKSGVKYKKYKQTIDFIRRNGYAAFIEKAKKWKGPYGTLK